MNRLKLKATVMVVHQPAKDRTYTESMSKARQLYDGLTGVVIDEHDSHGLCYEVKFPMGIMLITYDREELTEVK